MPDEQWYRKPKTSIDLSFIEFAIGEIDKAKPLKPVDQQTYIMLAVRMVGQLGPEVATQIVKEVVSDPAVVEVLDFGGVDNVDNLIASTTGQHPWTESIDTGFGLS